MNEAIFLNAINQFFQGELGTIHKHVARFDSYEVAFVALNSALDPEKLYLELDKAGVGFILSSNPLFPEALLEINPKPLGLYYKGNESFLKNLNNLLVIAIVGTRKASRLSLDFASELAKKLASYNCLIVSGLALGLDKAAHEGALLGGGKTVGVLSLGLDGVYPSSHLNLANQMIAQGGGLLSEYPLSVPAFPNRFLERNRIVAGLAKATIVIEAPLESGSLRTANNCIEFGRDLFVAPGALKQPNFLGSHALIKQGSYLITEPEDIIKYFNLEKASSENLILPLDLTDIEKDLVKILNQSNQLIDNLVDLTKLEPQILLRNLSALTLKGLVGETNGSYYLL